MIPLFQVNIPKDIGSIIEKVLLSGQITEGPASFEFQRQLESWLSVKHASLVNSGTSALTLACRLSGCQPGKFVISTPQTCLATNEAIMSLGADIIWSDIDPLTGAIDPFFVEKILKTDARAKDVVAIMCVDWAGNPVNLKELRRIADSHGIKLIEDAAHSFGALYENAKVGNQAHFTCFSFQAIKHLTTVDGGALVCELKEDHDRSVLLRWFGSARAVNRDPVRWEGDVSEYGYKFHMNDVTASIGIEQLKTIDSVIDKHKSNGKQLLEFIDSLPSGKIQRLRMEQNSESSHWIFSLLLPNKEARQRFVEEMKKCGVSTGIVHTRNDAYSLFSKYKTGLKGMDEFSERMINVPCGWWIDSHDLYHICKSIEQSV